MGLAHGPGSTARPWFLPGPCTPGSPWAARVHRRGPGSTAGPRSPPGPGLRRAQVHRQARVPYILVASAWSVFNMYLISLLYLMDCFKCQQIVVEICKCPYEPFPCVESGHTAVSYEKQRNVGVDQDVAQFDSLYIYNIIYYIYIYIYIYSQYPLCRPLTLIS